MSLPHPEFHTTLAFELSRHPSNKWMSVSYIKNLPLHWYWTLSFRFSPLVEHHKWIRTFQLSPLTLIHAPVITWLFLRLTTNCLTLSVSSSIIFSFSLTILTKYSTTSSSCPIWLALLLLVKCCTLVLRSSISLVFLANSTFKDLIYAWESTMRETSVVCLCWIRRS